ncbi:hypothetical protein P691DRAFT_801278 [Macrolepiota fuliginosa MF-IS2]|uniref:Uncharacterized protein n=1 Tax=Macrolepiota fuliginosa MF-IS2 TaxID=1400762 RepID=A0A9P6C3X7_9AGAR|nr:hypothetical protein P691DRAFT_801278 [Macrolepiota fuliginosa MF-IS2]
MDCARIARSNKRLKACLLLALYSFIHSFPLALSLSSLASGLSLPLTGLQSLLTKIFARHPDLQPLSGSPALLHCYRHTQHKL